MTSVMEGSSTSSRTVPRGIAGCAVLHARQQQSKVIKPNADIFDTVCCGLLLLLTPVSVLVLLLLLLHVGGCSTVQRWCILCLQADTYTASADLPQPPHWRSTHMNRCRANNMRRIVPDEGWLAAGCPIHSRCHRTGQVSYMLTHLHASQASGP